MALGEQINQSIRKFDHDLAMLLYEKHIGAHLLNIPESVHIEPKSRRQLPELQRSFADAKESRSMAVIQDEWRFLTIVRTIGSYTMPNFGDINWVIISEPKLEDSVQSYIKLKAVKFLVDDVDVMKEILHQRRVTYDLSPDGLEVPLNSHGQMILLSDVTTEVGIDERFRNGSAVKVQLHQDDLLQNS